MANNRTVSLQEFIASLDQTGLPRIIHVCSGVYFAGSVYELSGSEVCLSTGDIIKVIGIEPLSVNCEDCSTNEKFELPLNHTGLFKLVPEEMPYSSVEEMVSMRPVGLDSCFPFTFNSHSEMTFENFVLGAGRAVTMLSVKEREGAETCVRCQLQGLQGAAAEVLVPLSCRGQFYECESDYGYTVQEIMASPHLKTRRFSFSKATMCPGPLVLSPIYQIQAIMHLRKNIVKFPSTLEVDVEDITEQSQDMIFVSPLTLSEVHSQPEEAFPTMAEILEGPETQALFRCSWLPELRKGHHLVLHGRGMSAMVLASSLKGRRARQYFLVSQGYGGRLRRRPREFNSVYELYAASARAPGMQVSVMRHCEEVEEEGVPALCVGEQLEVLRLEKAELRCEGGQRRTVEALLCRRPRETEDEEDEEDEEEKEEGVSEEVLLPLYMQSNFVEKITDKKKYTLEDLGKSFSLPLDVKVVTRDAELEMDPLVGFSSLTLEEATREPVILASLPGRPERCFEIPVRWVSISVSFTRDPLPWHGGPAPKPHLEAVTETTDEFYYKFCTMKGSDEPPPPRPPKRKPTSDVSVKKTHSKPTSSCHERKSKTLTTEMSSLGLGHNKPPRPPGPPPPVIPDKSPPPPNPRKPMAAGKAEPNTYVKVDTGRKKGTAKVDLCDITSDMDSDHDYESVDGIMDMVKKAQESVLFF